MQSLLRVIYEHLEKASPSQTSQLLYSLVKLRLPEDDLISALTSQCEDQVALMTPKDLATCLWALARLDYPASEEFKMKLVIKVKEVLT